MLLLLLSSAPHYVLHSFPTRRSSDLPPPAGTNPPGGGSAATGLRYVSLAVGNLAEVVAAVRQAGCEVQVEDRKSTRLNSSHVAISYAVFCLKKKNKYIFIIY